MAYENYLEELERLAAGTLTNRTPVKISVKRSYFGAGAVEIAADGLAASSLKVAVFSAGAVKGSKALVVVPVRPIEEIDDITDGTPATAIGTLGLGHAVALDIGSRTLMPAGPATVPAFRVPKL